MKIKGKDKVEFYVCWFLFRCFSLCLSWFDGKAVEKSVVVCEVVDVCDCLSARQCNVMKCSEQRLNSADKLCSVVECSIVDVYICVVPRDNMLSEKGFK